MASEFPEADVKALKTLCERFNPKTAIEIGTYEGTSALIILDYVESLICVDWFKGNIGTPLGNAYEAFIENLSKHEKKNNVKVLVMKSEEAAFLIEEQVDMVFIDADHRYSEVKKDISLWLPKVKYGGVICGHDFEMFTCNCPPGKEEQDSYGGKHYGVIKAVTEYFPSVNKLANLWWVRV